MIATLRKQNRKDRSTVTRITSPVSMLVMDVAYNPCVVAIELCGSSTANRAIWAHLVARKKQSYNYRTDITVNMVGEDKTLYMDHQRTFSSKTHGNNLLVMAKDAAESKRTIMFGGDMTNPSPYFMDAMRLSVRDVPVLNEWENDLWLAGLSKLGIIPLKVYGAPGLNFWKLDPNKWEQIVKDLVEERRSEWLN